MASVLQDTNLLAQRHTAKFYVMVYALLSVAVMLANVLRTLAAVRGSFNAAKALHEQLLGHVLLLPMAFFDSQPLGRLLNRFTKDTEAVDVELLKLVSGLPDSGGCAAVAVACDYGCAVLCGALQCCPAAMYCTVL